MDLTAYFLLIVAIGIGVIGQLLLKYGMLQQQGFRLAELMTLLHNRPVIGGFCCYGLSTLLYFKVLASLDLSLAYPTVSLGYVLVILMSKIFFREEITLSRWTAAMIISAGVVLVGLGSV